jgi:hypothetical protein
VNPHGDWLVTRHWRHRAIFHIVPFPCVCVSLVALVIALVAALLGFGGIPGAAAGIAQTLFYVFRQKPGDRGGSAPVEIVEEEVVRRRESGPPCGVPSSTGRTKPSSITPAIRNARMS